MTCIDLSVEDLIRCSFGLSKREVVVLLRMLEAGDWMPISSIAALSRRDRSVVQRALSALCRKGIAERDQRNRETGGYEYLYRAKDKRAIKRAIAEKSGAFMAMVQKQVRQW